MFFPFQPPVSEPLLQAHPHLFISKLHSLPENTQPGRASKGSSISDHIPFIKQRTGQKCYILSSLTSTFLVSKAVKPVNDKTRYRTRFPDRFSSTHPNRLTVQRTARTIGFTEFYYFKPMRFKGKKRNFALCLPEADCPWQWWSPAAGSALGGSLSQLCFCSTSLTKSTQTTILWLPHAPNGR